MDRDFLEVVFTLASQGHESLIDQVVPLLKKSMGFNHDNANLILRLVSIGKEEVGYRYKLAFTFPLCKWSNDINDRPLVHV